MCDVLVLLLTVYVWCVVSAINAENGEANKVRNVVNSEIGAVPAVARFYKVQALQLHNVIMCCITVNEHDNIMNYDDDDDDIIDKNCSLPPLNDVLTLLHIENSKKL